MKLTQTNIYMFKTRLLAKFSEHVPKVNFDMTYNPIVRNLIIYVYCSEN